MKSIQAALIGIGFAIITVAVRDRAVPFVINLIIALVWLNIGAVNHAIDAKTDRRRR